MVNHCIFSKSQWFHCTSTVFPLYVFAVYLVHIICFACYCNFRYRIGQVLRNVSCNKTMAKYFSTVSWSYIRCTENKNSCIADVFQLLCCHLLIVSFRVRAGISLGNDLLLLSTQVPSESEILLQTVTRFFYRIFDSKCNSSH